MDKITKLSQAIRYGSTFLKEYQNFVEFNEAGQPCGGCAIGTAYLAITNQLKNRNDFFGSGTNIIEEVSNRFPDVPRELINQISSMHFSERLNRAGAAEYLENLGY